MSEVADIFREYGGSYRDKHKLPLHILKAMNAIEKCRTDFYGGHVDECDECGHVEISYNSCRNRHCPKCQASAREKWLNARMEDLLPVGYFHIVLTLPQELNPLALRNQETVYNILFKAGSETLLELGRDTSHLGGEIGFITILHTWGQNLMDHPHLHCIVPGGGLSFDGKRWIKTEKDFFVHVNVISELFRDKFLYYLKKSFNEGKIRFTGNISMLEDQIMFKDFIDKLFNKKWITFCKPPFGGPEQVLEYIARYTHRVAISNSRIMEVQDGKVTFKWRDYKDSNKLKEMTITAEEFIRRFLLHVLPDGFVKIRYYGILGNRNLKTKLKKCKELLSSDDKRYETKIKENDLLEEFVDKDLMICIHCGKGIMRCRQIMLPKKLAPPAELSIA